MQDNSVNETKNIVEVGIDSSIEESYLAYSMSVIVGALYRTLEMA